MCNETNACETDIKMEVKTERMDDYPDFTVSPVRGEIKEEPEPFEIHQSDDPEGFSRPWETYDDPDPIPPRREIVFTCRICTHERKVKNPKKFKSIIALTKHLNNHTKRCPDCRQIFKTWKQIDEHEPYCPRRFGVNDVRPEKRSKPAKPVRTPYRCQLCKRKYETKDHLINHQINRCVARYRTHAWIVKI